MLRLLQKIMTLVKVTPSSHTITKRLAMLKNCLFIVLCLHSYAYAAEYAPCIDTFMNPLDYRYSQTNYWETSHKNLLLTGFAIALIESDRDAKRSKSDNENMLEILVDHITAKGARLTGEKTETLKPKLKEELLARKAELEINSCRILEMPAG